MRYCQPTFSFDPLLGAYRLPLALQSGAIAASMFYEHLADASGTALMRLRFALINIFLRFGHFWPPLLRGG